MQRKLALLGGALAAFGTLALRRRRQRHLPAGAALEADARAEELRLKLQDKRAQGESEDLAVPSSVEEASSEGEPGRQRPAAEQEPGSVDALRRSVHAQGRALSESLQHDGEQEESE